MGPTNQPTRRIYTIHPSILTNPHSYGALPPKRKLYPHIYQMIISKDLETNSAQLIKQGIFTTIFRYQFM